MRWDGLGLGGMEWGRVGWDVVGGVGLPQIIKVGTVGRGLGVGARGLG